MRHSKKNLKIFIILGPPGSGKGTQAELLAEKFDLYHWETSKILGRIIEINNKTSRGINYAVSKNRQNCKHNISCYFVDVNF